MTKHSNTSKSKKTKNSDLPSKPWYKNTMAVFALISTVVAAITGLIALSQQFIQPAKFEHNAMIVFDRSLAMSESFEQRTKLDAAIEAVDKVMSDQVAGTDNLALRSFGGPCNGENSQLALKFRPQNEERIKEVVRRYTAQGDTTLTDAIIEAIGDFSDAKRFEGKSKKIIVITGGVDTCHDEQDTDPATYIRNRLQSLPEKIEINFRFVGMALDAEGREQLTAIARETGGLSDETTDDQVFFVETLDELQTVLTQVIDIEPILDTANGMGDIMNNVTDHLNDAIRSIREEDYSAAEEGLQAAKDEFKDTQVLLTDFGQGLKLPGFQEQFQKLYELLTANRNLQEKQIELLEDMIAQGKRGDTDALQDTILEWNQVLSEFNSNVGEMDTITREIVERLREQREQ